MNSSRCNVFYTYVLVVNAWVFKIKLNFGYTKYKNINLIYLFCFDKKFHSYY